MITVTFTDQESKLIEDALVRFSIVYPERSDECIETFRKVINARHDLRVKEISLENNNTDWLKDSKEIA